MCNQTLATVVADHISNQITKIFTMKTCIPLPPPGKLVAEDLDARKSWHRVQFLAEQFWSRWRKEYLANILRQRWHSPKRNGRRYCYSQGRKPTP